MPDAPQTPPGPPQTTSATLSIHPHVPTPPAADADFDIDGPDPRLGKTLGSYKLVGVLGRGGMGVVYEAIDARTGTPAALKLLPPELGKDPTAVARFESEARAACRVRHSNVVTLFEFGKAGRTCYMAMELVRGGSAKGFLDARGAFNWPESTRVIADACRGLVACHAAGLIHRDIKPANIIRSVEGVVKLADFGLAKSTDSDRNSITGSGIVGTPDYMSPEQCRAEKLDHRTDIYSLGAAFYSLLTGKAPFAGAGNPVQIMFAHCSNPTPDPREVNSLVPDRCVAVIDRAMAKDRDARYGSAAEMLEDLEAILGGTSQVAVARAPGWTDFLQASDTLSHKRVVKHPAPRRSVAFYGIAGLALLGAGVGGVWLWKQVDHPRIVPTKPKPADEVPEPIAKLPDPEIKKDPAIKTPDPEVKKEPKIAPEPTEAQEWLHIALTAPAAKQSQMVRDRLVLRNPGLTAAQIQVKLDGSGRVFELSFPADQVTDLSPLRALPTLQRLFCDGAAGQPRKAALRNLSPLADLPAIDTVHVRNTSVRGLVALRGAPISILDISGSDVTDLTPLANPANLPKLVRLYCGRTGISDLAPLRGRPLARLDIDSTSVVDLSPLQGMPLNSLHIEHSGVRDLRPIANLRLQQLTIQSLPIIDLTLLRGIPLQHFDCDPEHIVAHPFIPDLPGLAGLNNASIAEFRAKQQAARADREAWEKSAAGLTGKPLLEAVLNRLAQTNGQYARGHEPKFDGERVVGLNLRGQERVRDISALAALRDLRELDINGTAVIDLSPLAKLPLVKLDLGASRVYDLRPLAKVPLEELELYGTRVTDLLPVADAPIRSLGLNGVGVGDLSVLSRFKLRALTMYFDRNLHTKLLQSIGTLETVNGKPARDVLSGKVDAN